MIATILVVPFFLRSQIRRGIDALRGRKPAAPEATGVAANGDGPVPLSGD